ncbi:MAG TPA: GAF domain-containing protein [Thermoflexia bacterium]|nr:GAF domain-containing protein [Thermoflexia bacterium]
MTIRKRLALMTLLCFAIILVAGAGMILAEREHEKETEVQEHIAAVQERVVLLNPLTSDYLLFLNDRAEQQWMLVNGELEQELAELPSHFGRDHDALIELQESHAKLSQLFTRLCEAVDTGAPGEENAKALALRDELASQLHLLSKNMREQISHLAQETQEKHDRIQSMMNYLTNVAFLALVFLLLGLLLWVRRSILKPLELLQSGTETIAGGDYERTILIDSQDELGALANSFNKMAGAVKEKVTDLNAELWERKRAEEQIRQKTQDLTLVNLLNDAVNRGDSLQELTRLLSEETKRIFSSHGATLYLLSEDRERLIMQNLALPPAMTKQLEKLIGMRVPAISIPLKAEGLYLETLHTGESRLINDPETIQRLMAEFVETAHLSKVLRRMVRKLIPQIYRLLGIQSTIIVPLAAEGESLGLLDIARAEPFTESDLKRFEAIAGQLTAIIKRKQAEEALQERATRLELIARVGHRTTAILDLDALLHQAVNLIGDTFGYYNVAILLVEGDDIVLMATTLPAAHHLERRTRLRVGCEGITGWVAGSGEPLLVPDVSQEPRYRNVLEGTKTRSELAVPIKLKGLVIGVLDVQSDEKDAFSEEDTVVLQTLADQLAVAIENAKLYERIRRYAAQLEQRVAERTAELTAVNKELESFAYSVSHDLRAPLRSIDGFSHALQEDYPDKLDATGQDYLNRVRAASQRMGQLIDDLLKLSRLTRGQMRREQIDLSGLAREIAGELRETQPGRAAEFVIEPDLAADGDARLLRVMLQNLLGNAWKFTAHHPRARIEFGVTEHDGERAYFVRDDGAGFDMAYADKLFGAFQRLHTRTEFEGSGIGLATVQRIVYRHGGRVWAKGAVEQGATFYFTLPSRGDETE